MIGTEVMAAIRRLRVSPEELAEEFDVSARTVRRWCASGAPGAAAYAIRAALRLDALHLAWRKGAVNIGIVAGGVIRQLSDAEAAAHHARLA